jgi:hypothetical protein
MSLDYKQKYLELRAKMLENIEISYRLGYEHGASEAQLSAMQQTQAQAQEITPPQEQIPNNQTGIPEASVNEYGDMSELDASNLSELDSSIQELENLVAKGEKPTILCMREAVNKLAELRKTQQEKMKRNQTQVTSSQKSLVDGILKKWEKEVNSDKIGLELESIINEKMSDK